MHEHANMRMKVAMDRGETQGAAACSMRLLAMLAQMAISCVPSSVLLLLLLLVGQVGRSEAALDGPTGHSRVAGVFDSPEGSRVESAPADPE